MAKTGGRGTAAAAGAAGSHQMYEMPNRLQAKIGARQGTKQNALNLAQDVLESVKPRYEGRFEKDMRALKAVFDQMQDAQDYNLELLITKVHDIRGEAGTFGYGLVSEIGRLLCEYIASIEQVGTVERMAISAHLQAMQTVVADKIKGTGPEVAKQIIAGLNTIIANSKA